jgi:hypothetical protein
MRKIFTLSLLVFSLNSFSQDSIRVEQYCKVIEKVEFNRISVDYGDAKKTWKDANHAVRQEKFPKFDSIVDAMNYMGKNGWILLTVVSAPPSRLSDLELHYIFKKSILKSELEQTPN